MNTDLPIVGIVLHFRTVDCTASCLQSLFAQKIRKVLVVDNSQDYGRSLAILRPILNRLEKQGMRVKLLQPKTNLGFAAGVNEGLKCMLSDKCSEHAFVTNSDVTFCKNSVGEMLESMNKFDFVAPRVLAESVAGNLSPIIYYQKMCSLYLRRKWPGTLRYPSGTCLMINNRVLSADLFCEDFFFYGEDVMLGHALRRLNREFGECEDAIIRHKGSASARNGSIFYEYHMVRAHWLLASRLAENRYIRLVYCGVRCIILPARCIVRCMRFSSMQPLRGLIMATVDALRGRCRNLTPPP